MTPQTRHLAHPAFSPPQASPRNGLVRAALGALRDTNCVNQCEPEIIATETTVSTLQRIRGPELRALKTVVANAGSHDVYLFEDMRLIEIIPPGKSTLLVTTGQHALYATASGGSIISVTTYRRCQCGQPVQPYVTDPQTAPIGAFLL